MSTKVAEKYEQLVAAYLSGNVTDAEVSDLEAWVREDPVNQAYFVNAKRAWTLGSLNREVPNLDVAASWQKVLQETGQTAQRVDLNPPRRIETRRWWAVAATLAVLVAAGWWFLGGVSQSPVHLVADSDVREETLPDGSTVALNRGTQLTYQWDRQQGIRMVKLEGDAFFNVKHNAKQPFRIEASGITVEVLGTSFYVDAASHLDTARVIVQSGKVAVSFDEEQVVLEAGELSLIDRDSRILSKTENQDPNYLTWQTNVFHFENVTLIEIVQKLNGHFEGDIEIANDVIASCRMTATFSNKSLPSIVAVIEKTLGIKAENNQGRTILVGSRCN